MLGQAFDNGHVVAAVCHGPAALVHVRVKDGELLVHGRRITGFSDAEERLLQMEDVVPFLLETKLRKIGALYEKADPWAECVVEDGGLVTGQNPASALGTAQAVMRLLKPQLASAT